MKKLIMTGAAGSIGRYCIPLLLDRGYEIHAVYHTRIAEEYKDAVQWVRADLLNDVRLVQAYLMETRPQYMLHLAWDVTPGIYKNSPENLKWLGASLELIRGFIEGGGRRLITAGTCFEYDLTDGILKEDTTPLRPDTLYGECKAALYRIAAHYCKIKGVSYGHGRIFYPYGPHDAPQKLITYAIRQLMKNETISCSSGEQIRDYIYVRDVAELFTALLDSSLEQAVNIGTGRGSKLKDMLKQIECFCGCNDKIQFGENFGNEAPVIVADNAKAAAGLGIGHFHQLCEVLDEMTAGLDRGPSIKV